MELENGVGEVQVKLVLHMGHRQEEVVNYFETDKSKFSLKKIAIIIIIYRFGDFSQRPLCSWTRLAQKCDNSSPPSQNMRSIHKVKIRSVPSMLCSTLSTCFYLLRKSHQWFDVFWTGKSWLGGWGGGCGYYFIGGGTGICSRAQTKVILVLNVGLILMKMTTARRGLTCFAKSMIKYLFQIFAWR